MNAPKIVKHVWTGPRAALDCVQSFLTEFMDDAAVGFRPAPGPDGVAPVDGSPEADRADWMLEYYADAGADVAALDQRISEYADAVGVDLSAVARLPGEELPDLNWVQHSLDGLGLVEVGRFVLHGVHDDAKAAARAASDPRAIRIRIDANQAFGTGHHPTTFGCLAMLDRFAGAPPQRVLDLGCGSGVLSIAAAKLWDMEVLGVDIDPMSVAIARENAGLNGVAEKVRAEEADGPGHPTVASAGPFDFVFANILAGPLVEFAPGLASIIPPRGRVLLAGLMAEQEKSVATAYEGAGFRQINRLPPTGGPARGDDEAPQHPAWPILLFVRT